MNFKIISQNDTQNKKVILTENQAREVIKDLERYEGMKKISVLQEKRINGLLEQSANYEKIVAIQDSIIKNKEEIIALKNKLLKTPKIKFNSYVGAESFNLQINNPTIYYRVNLELPQFNFGGRLNLEPNSPYKEGIFYFNIYVEYKIF